MRADCGALDGDVLGERREEEEEEEDRSRITPAGCGDSSLDRSHRERSHTDRTAGQLPGETTTRRDERTIPVVLMILRFFGGGGGGVYASERVKENAAEMSVAPLYVLL